MLDGIVILESTIGALTTGNDLEFTTNDAGLGLALHGCIRNLRLANDATFLTIFADGFETPDGILAWSNDESGLRDGEELAARRLAPAASALHDPEESSSRLVNS